MKIFKTILDQFKRIIAVILQLPEKAYHIRKRKRMVETFKVPKYNISYDMSAGLCGNNTFAGVIMWVCGGWLYPDQLYWVSILSS